MKDIIMNNKSTAVAGVGDGRINDDAVIEIYQRILNPDAAKEFDKTNGWFARYNGKLVDPDQGRRYLRAIRNTVLIPDEQLQGKKVLDIGCGELRKYTVSTCSRRWSIP